MTCRQSRFYTLDITGFLLRFINFKFSRFLSIRYFVHLLVRPICHGSLQVILEPALAYTTIHIHRGG